MSSNDLTDAQLRAELKSYGVTSIGPINASTRGAYLKKLERLRKDLPAGGSNHDISNSDSLSQASNSTLPDKRRSQVKNIQ